MSEESPKFSGTIPEQPFYEEDPTRSLYLGTFCDASGNPLPYGGSSPYGRPTDYPHIGDDEFAGYLSQSGSRDFGRTAEDYDIFGRAVYADAEPDDFFAEMEEAPSVDSGSEKRRANGFFVLTAILLAVALLGVSGYFGWDWYQSRIRAQAERQAGQAVEEHPAFIAEQAVVPMFEALKQGDGDALLESWVDGEDLTEQERALMTTAHYKNVGQRITGYKVRDEVEYIDEETGKIIVDVVQDESRQSISLTVKRIRMDYGFYPVWKVKGAPLISPITITVDKEVSEASVNSVKVPLTIGNGKSTGMVRVLPGLYDIVVPEDAPAQLRVTDRGVSNVTEVQKIYAAEKETRVLKKIGAGQSEEDVEVEMAPSEFVREQVREQVDFYLRGCARSRAPVNSECPFSYSGFEISEDLARNFSYEIVKQPVMDEIQVLEEGERHYTDAAGSFQWGRIASLSSGSVRKTWEFNIGTLRRPSWQSRDTMQSFSVNFDIVISGGRFIVVPHR